MIPTRAPHNSVCAFRPWATERQPPFSQRVRQAEETRRGGSQCGEALSWRLCGNGGVMMRQMWLWKRTVVCLTVLTLLLLGITGAQAQTPPLAGKAQVDRLELGLIEKDRD